MFEGFEVRGGQIYPDLLGFSYPPIIYIYYLYKCSLIYVLNYIYILYTLNICSIPILVHFTRPCFPPVFELSRGRLVGDGLLLLSCLRGASQNRGDSGCRWIQGTLYRKHGSLNVPIEHHPTIRYMVYNGYYKVMSNSPKMGHLPIPGKPAFLNSNFPSTKSDSGKLRELQRKNGGVSAKQAILTMWNWEVSVCFSETW